MALCSPKILRGLHGQARKLGLEHDDLSCMVSTGSLATVPEREAAELLRRLQEQENPPQSPFHKGGGAGRKIWRLYSSSALAREIDLYRRSIYWEGPDGFRSWLMRYHGIERLEWVDSLDKAIAIKNGLKRMYNRGRNDLA